MKKAIQYNGKNDNELFINFGIGIYDMNIQFGDYVVKSNDGTIKKINCNFFKNKQIL